MKVPLKEIWLSTEAPPSWSPISPSPHKIRTQRKSNCVKLESFFLFFFFLKFTFFYLFIYLFIHLWLCWVFASVRGPSPVAASGDHSSSRCAGLSPSRPLLFWSTGSSRAGSAIVAHGPSRSAACGILPDQGSNPCPLHRQADPQPLRHQGSPRVSLQRYPQSLDLFSSPSLLIP